MRRTDKAGQSQKSNLNSITVYWPKFAHSHIKSLISASTERFYVYVLCYQDGRPFYVGKGVDYRVLQHEAEARNLPTCSHKLNVIRSIIRSGQRVGYVLDSFFADEAAAHVRERELIQLIGRHDLGIGPLTNQTDGGEGTSNPSQESRTRRRATLGGDATDPDRRIINDFFRSFGADHDSIPIKPLGARKLIHLTPHPSPRQPTPRMTQTILACAVARGALLNPGTTLPRKFEINGSVFVIENGVGRDMLKAGVIALEHRPALPENEILRLTPNGFRYLEQQIGRARLLDLGAIEPDIQAHIPSS